VIAGGSGAGKSTLALSLALEGFEFMGDDLVFVDERSGKLRVGALCEELDLTTWTAETVLGLAVDEPLEPGWPKHRVQPQAIFGNRLADDAAPGLVLFPRRSDDEPDPAATPISSGEALGRLAPDILLTDRALVAGHLAALGALVEASDCFEVAVGTDAQATARLVRSLL
jgi:hypothetical protein